MTDAAVYSGLFTASLVAATVLPAQSELLLAALLVSGEQAAWKLIGVAWVGNTLGSAINWALGKFLCRFRDRKWFPIGPEVLDKAQGWYGRYGRWSLLLSWAPFIGDPITVAAGVMREPWWSFVSIVALAKLIRYMVVAGIALHGLV